MKKILVHENGGDPIYIAMCEYFYFHVIYKDMTISTHDMHWDAISKATSELILDDSRGNLGWQPILQ
jgi:hypothetical protein